MSANTSSDQANKKSFIHKALAITSDSASRHSLLILYLQEQIARVLNLPISQVNSQQALGSFGFDSLTAIELQSEIETDLGLSLPMVDLLGDLSLNQVATDILVQWSTQSLSPASPKATASGGSSAPPILPGQRALWFQHQLAPESAAYIIARAVRIRSQLDVVALRRTLQKLVDRHPTLRLTFVAIQGEPVCQGQKKAEVFFQQIDAIAWDEQRFQECLAEEAHRPFNLEEGPLFRIYLFTRSTREHVLLLTAHHIIADLWSIAVLVRELDSLYRLETTQTKVELPPQDPQYVNYIRWQINRLEAPEGERDWTYWQSQLGGELPTLALPTDRLRPPSQSYRGDTFDFKLDQGLTLRLKALAKREAATLYMTLLSAFYVLLYRYARQEDILVGSPTAGRARAEAVDLVGYFVNPIVLRANLSGNPPFTALLAQVRQTVLAALAHQNYPFPLLVERLQPKRDSSQSPIFQVMFALQKAPRRGNKGLSAFIAGEPGVQADVGGMLVEPVSLTQRAAQFDLFLAMTEVADNLVASLQYSTDLFSHSTITQMAACFQQLLESIVFEPTQRLSTLTSATMAEREQLLAWNQTQAAHATDRYGHELIAAQANAKADKTAVIYEDESLSYQSLNERANQLAHHLQALGVGPESPVGVCVGRSLDMVVGILAILKAGGAYLPLDPAYPQERLAFILEDAQVSIVLTQQHLRSALPARQSVSHVILLDRDWDTIATFPDCDPDSFITAANLAYVIYTSGSTGSPKGVLVTHGNLLNLVHWHIHAFGFSPADRAAQMAALTFDASAGELWPYLAAGVSMQVVDEETRLMPAPLHHWLLTENITVVFLPTLLAEQLLTLAWPERTPLRLMLSGGDKLHHHPETHLPFALYNDYGPTENTVVSTSGLVTPAADETHPPTIGRPIDNVQVYILDTHLNPTPIGTPGELHLAGAGVTRGYLNQPGLTAAKFIPNPFLQAEAGTTESDASVHPAECRLYKTGDLARYLADGRIEFLGRVDHQVKIRGFRIELGEIEAALAQHPAVQEAVVLAREDTPGDRRLVAYLVAETEPLPTHSDLRHFLQQKLPAYMTPAAFVMLESLPLTPHGKVDRAALPVPDLARPELDVTFIAPRTAVEETVAGLWAELLNVEQVGVDDNFFDLGGHSLLATQLLSRLQAAFPEVELSLRHFFETPSVAGIAESIETLLWVTRNARPFTSSTKRYREEGEL